MNAPLPAHHRSCSSRSCAGPDISLTSGRPCSALGLKAAPPLHTPGQKREPRAPRDPYDAHQTATFEHRPSWLPAKAFTFLHAQRRQTGAWVILVWPLTWLRSAQWATRPFPLRDTHCTPLRQARSQKAAPPATQYEARAQTSIRFVRGWREGCLRLQRQEVLYLPPQRPLRLPLRQDPRSWRR
jgi:hypothetical protein